MSRVVVVTGGKRGVGAAISAHLAAGGRTVHALSSADCDVTDEARVAEVLGSLAVDVLVNNAGVSDSAPVQRTTLAQWRTQLDVNALGAFLCTRAVLPGMAERGHGRIVTVASVASHHGSRYQSVEHACQAAAAGLQRAVVAQVVWA